jgi:hypothetical protein
MDSSREDLKSEGGCVIGAEALRENIRGSATCADSTGIIRCLAL